MFGDLFGSGGSVTYPGMEPETQAAFRDMVSTSKNISSDAKARGEEIGGDGGFARA